jgi:hypothetical protein
VANSVIRVLKYVAASVLILIGVILVGLILLRLCSQNRTAARIHIRSTAGIYTIEKVHLGGVEQRIQILGNCRTKPIRTKYPELFEAYVAL